MNAMTQAQKIRVLSGADSALPWSFDTPSLSGRSQTATDAIGCQGATLGVNSRQNAAMSTVTFDTLKFVKTLQSAGMPPAQAEAVSIAVRDAHDAANLVTRKDLDLAMAPIHTKLSLLQWMVTATFAGVGVVLAKLFFG